MNLSTALQAAESLSLDEKIEFVQHLWDQIVDAGWQPTLTKELKEELDRRIASLEANPDKVLTWEQVEAHVRRQR